MERALEDCPRHEHPQPAPMIMEELEALERKQLQALAKEFGVKANQKSAAIIGELLALRGNTTPASSKRRSSAKEPAVQMPGAPEDAVLASPQEVKRRSSVKASKTQEAKGELQHGGQAAPEALTCSIVAAASRTPTSSKKRRSSAKQLVELTSTASSEAAVVASPRQEKCRSSAKPSKMPEAKQGLPLERKQRGSDAFWKRVPPQKAESSTSAKPPSQEHKQAAMKPVLSAGAAGGGFNIGVKDSQRTGYRVPKAFVVKKSVKSLTTVVPFKAGERPATAHSRTARQDENAKGNANIKAAGSDAKFAQASAARKHQIVAASSSARATALNSARGIGTGASKNAAPWRGTGYKAATLK